MELKTLDAIGYKNQQVPNTLVVQPEPTGHLGIILPGYRHFAGMADLLETYFRHQSLSYVEERRKRMKGEG